MLDWTCRIAIAAVFLLAALPKLLDPLAFAKAITNYKLVLPLIGQNYVFPTAMFMPALEAVVAAAVLLPRTKRAGSVMAGGLMLLFIVLIAQALARGLNIDCGCFGSGGAAAMLAQKVGIDKILQNTAVLAGCIFVYWRAGMTQVVTAPAKRDESLLR